MAGGLIEGFQKLFKGKNVAQKHIFLFVIAVIVAFCNKSAITNSNSILFILILIFLNLGATILAGLYYLHFTHNAVKFCLYRDREDNIQKVKAIQIMPEVNLNLFAHFWSWIGFWLLWDLMLFAIGLLAKIPLIGILFGLALLVFSFCWAFTSPIIAAKFAENYQIKGNVSLSLIFSYFPKVFVPMFLLSLKILCIVIVPAGIIYLLHSLRIFTSMNPYLLNSLVAIGIYLLMLLNLSYTYEVANIYYNNIKLNEEI